MSSVWLILPAIVAVLAGGSIFVCSGKVRRFHTFLAFTIIFDGLWTLLAAYVRSRFPVLSLPLYFLGTAMMLVTPIFYYLSCRFLFKAETFRKSDLWMLEAVVVFLLTAIASASATDFAGRSVFLNYIRSGGYSALPTGAAVMVALDNAATVFFLLEFTAAVIVCYLGLRKYAGLLENYYSSTSNKSTRQINALSILVAVKVSAFAVIVLVPGLIGSNLAFAVKAVTDSLFYAAAAYLAINTVFTSEELLEAIHSSESKTDKLPPAFDVISGRLEKLIDEKFYVNPDIDLFGISEEIHVNAKYISEFIRYKYGESFMVFVNRLRVEHSIELMKDRNMNLLAISDDSRFVTPSTFYRNFMKLKGISPSEYRKKL